MSTNDTTQVVSSPKFRRSSRCRLNFCVEVAIEDSIVSIRDSRVVNGIVLKFTHSEWNAFVQGVKAGEFDV